LAVFADSIDVKTRSERPTSKTPNLEGDRRVERRSGVEHLLWHRGRSTGRGQLLRRGGQTGCGRDRCRVLRISQPARVGAVAVRRPGGGQPEAPASSRTRSTSTRRAIAKVRGCACLRRSSSQPSRPGSGRSGQESSPRTTQVFGCMRGPGFRVIGNRHHPGRDQRPGGAWRDVVLIERRSTTGLLCGRCEVVRAGADVPAGDRLRAGPRCRGGPGGGLGGGSGRAAGAARDRGLLHQPRGRRGAVARPRRQSRRQSRSGASPPAWSAG
jgi:hypothetical protein